MRRAAIERPAISFSSPQYPNVRWRANREPLSLPRLTNACAFAVHILTSAGAALALAALVYAAGAQWTAMFLCLGIALIIDGIDGTIARHVNVAEVLPRW